MRGWWIGGALTATMALSLTALMHLHAISDNWVGLPGMKPSKFKKNDHVALSTRATPEEYQVSYVFKDHKSRNWLLEWGYRRGATDQAVARYGLPLSIWEPYVATHENTTRRHEIIAAGLHRQVGQSIGPDYDRIIAAYAPFTEPLYRAARRILGATTRVELVEFLVKLIQDIPYGIPPSNIDGRSISGMLVPPQIMLEGWGDCDSKAVLLAAALVHDSEARVVFLRVPMHILMGIEAVPRPFQKSISYHGRTYVVTDPTGPGRPYMGSTGSHTYSRFQVIPIMMKMGANATTKVISRAVSVKRSYTDAGIHIESENLEAGELELHVRGSRTFTIGTDVRTSGHKLPPNRVFMERSGDKLRIRARALRAGRLTLRIFAAPLGHGGNLTLAFQYPFEVPEGSAMAADFPTQFGYFTEAGARLIAPLDAVLQAGTAQEFTIEVPGVQKVAVITSDDKWSQLGRREGDRFVGLVQLRQGIVGVFAKPLQSKRYKAILEYHAQ